MWPIQRVAWVVLGFVALAGFAGLFGSGPLAAAKTGSATDPISVEYDRFVRQEAMTALRVRVVTRGAESLEVWIDRDYLEGFRVHQVTPPPERVVIAADRLVYRFEVGEAGPAGLVRLDLEPDRSGVRRGRVGLPGGPTLAFTQLVYP